MTEKFLSENLPFWQKLTGEQRGMLVRHTRPVHYEKGALVHHGERDCLGVLLVQHGILRVSMLSAEGREILLFRVADGEICILSASCVLSQITFDVVIEAEEEIEGVVIPAGIYARLSEQNLYVENFSYKLITNCFSDVMWTMQQVLFTRFDQRLAQLLLAEEHDGSVHATHEQLAKRLGSAREVVTRMLRRFAAEGLVELARGEIILRDRKGLKRV